MTGETTITIIGNLTSDPQLRFTPSGAAVTNFTVAATPRHFDRQADQWRDGEALFLRCTIWRQPAEHAAQSLSRGARVIVTGRLRQRSYTDSNGIDRTIVELDVEEVGPSLKFTTVTLTKTTRSTPAAGGGGEPEGDGPGGADEAPF